MKRWSLVVAVLLVAGAFAAVALAAKTNITLKNPQFGVYTGKATSSDNACKRKRKVTVRHDQDGDGYDRRDFKIGTDRTNRRGVYRVNGNQAPTGDQIAAKVAKRTLDDGTVCRADTATAPAGAGPTIPGY